MDFNFGIEGILNQIIEEEPGHIVIGSTICTEDQIGSWLEAYEKKFKTVLNVARAYRPSSLSVFHKRYMCIHGCKRHKNMKKSYTGCLWTLNIRIRHVTESRNEFWNDHVTFPCLITIKGTHNHSLGTPEAMKQLRVLPSIKAKFFRYFDSGMTVSQAIKFHQQLYGNSISDIANRSINPSERAIRHLQYIWSKGNRKQERTPQQLVIEVLSEESRISSGDFPVITQPLDNITVDQCATNEDEITVKKEEDVETISKQICDHFAKIIDASNIQSLSKFKNTVLNCKSSNELCNFLCECANIEKKKEDKLKCSQSSVFKRLSNGQASSSESLNTETFTFPEGLEIYVKR